MLMKILNRSKISKQFEVNENFLKPINVPENFKPINVNEIFETDVNGIFLKSLEVNENFLEPLMLTKFLKPINVNEIFETDLYLFKFLKAI